MLPGEGVDDRHQRVAALGQRAAAGEREGGKGAESGGAAREGRRKGGGVRQGVGKGGLPRLTRCAASVEEAGERRLHSSPKAR